jgi:serine/threonine-protein kinase
MVTGQKPFNANSDYAIMSAHVKEVPRPPIELQPGLPSTLNEIILMAIAKDPAQRFQTADAFRNALSKVQPVAMPAAASTTRKATIVDSGLSSALFHEAPTVTAPPVAATSASRASDHARTVVDTRTPSSPGIAPQISTKAPSSPRVQPPPPPQTSHKGLYMALGALAVIAALAAVGIYSRKAEAGGNVSTTKSAPAPPQKVQPQKQEVAQPTPPPAPVTPPVTKAVAVAKIGIGKPQGNVSETAPPPPAEKPADLDALEHDIDQLTARAGSINSSLDRLQAEQARAGYGLRGDMAQHQSSMKLNLQKAQDAIEHGDAARAKRYKEYCEADVDALEKFLGR